MINDHENGNANDIYSRVPLHNFYWEVNDNDPTNPNKLTLDQTGKLTTKTEAEVAAMTH